MPIVYTLRLQDELNALATSSKAFHLFLQYRCYMLTHSLQLFTYRTVQMKIGNYSNMYHLIVQRMRFVWFISYQRLIHHHKLNVL